MKLKIATVNARSIKGKSSELLQHVLETNIDLCVISETWLKADGDDVIRGELLQEGFCFNDVPREDRKGGGLALLYRNNLKVSVCPYKEYRSFECVEWKISNQTLIFSVFGIYRPPYSERHPFTLASFIQEFTEFLERVSLYTTPIVIMGDFNIHMDNASDCYTKQFHHCLKTFDLIQNVTTKTHTGGHILDLIITRKGDKHTKVSEPLSDYYISDHCFVSCFIEQCRPPLVQTVVKYRNWKSVNVELLQQDLEQLKCLPERTSNVDDLVNTFSTTTSELIEKHAPLVEKTFINRPSVPWYSSYLRMLKQYKRTVEKLYLTDKTGIMKNVYRHVKDQYTAAVTKAKDNYYQDVIKDAEGNVKKLYNVTTNLLGRSKENPLPPHTNGASLATDFLHYFADKITKLRDTLDNINDDTSENVFDSSQISPCLQEFRPLTEREVVKLINESKATTCDLDVIPSSKLKHHMSSFASIITVIINRSLESGVFPKEWKLALIKPLLKKKGLPLELQNYRPVSNLSFLSKILEKAALSQITDFIECNKLLPPYQSAYRRYHGVETAMLKMYSDILNAVDLNLVTIVVMIDLSAAFDTIDIPIVLQLMRTEFGIDNMALKWIESYLTDRSMKVQIEHTASDTIPLLYGVPQGSCAGPVIFTMYIAALNRVVKNYPADLYGYADDHKVAFRVQAGKHENESSILNQLQNCLENINSWMTTFKLKMNNSKTEIIAYGTKQQLDKLNITDVSVGGCKVTCVDHVRDLGVHMTSTLNFDLHIRKKCQTAHNQLRNLRGIRKHVTQKSAETLVHGLIHSHLDFCNGLFADIPAYQLDKLQKVQNQAARVVLNATYDQNSNDLLKQLHWLPVRARIMFKVLVIVFRVVQGTAPSYLRDMLKEAIVCAQQVAFSLLFHGAEQN